MKESLRVLFWFFGYFVIGGLLFGVHSFSSLQSQEAPSEEGSEASETPKASEFIPDPQFSSAEALLQFVATQEMSTAIENGLEALVELQNEADGSFGDGNKVATTSLAGLALLASGSLPGSGPYGSQLVRVIDFLLSIQDPNNGYFSLPDDGSRIHGHAYAITFFCNVYGYSQNDHRIRAAIKQGVTLLKAGQTQDGGWGYVPDDLQFDEGSTTVCCLQALRAAQEVGIAVPFSVIARAIGYLKKIAVPKVLQVDTEIFDGYTFKYSLSTNTLSNSWALVGASCACLNNIGIYADHAQWDEKNMGSILEGGMNWLRYKQQDFIERYQRREWDLDTSHFYYANFYACQAAWQYADTEYFRSYFPRIRDLYIQEQKENGGRAWKNSRYGQAYSTSMVLLTLQLPYQYLPMYQR